jgi:hypothetical protein
MTETGGVVELDVNISSESPDLLVGDGNNNNTKRVIRRDLGFTQVENCIVAKAFIATSKDSIVRVSQKGAQFFAKMQANNIIPCGQQELSKRFKGYLPPHVMKFMGVARLPSGSVIVIMEI